ncbi:tetratricopeptide (TPR) repeat protein [Kitasatospora herbaricolor]|uniref:DUF5107 domain-containing protein n=1 Tax=Kitasatospora herbaricolor TaxID=68217 RepID=UPI0027919C36|nr:DUF5107 domain-containing protein [Kitasatospora herbaricolor]MDQ0306782.1 tetratricopeptide (TPR) repeat protein [Kitasatospora herbaricolor]
MSELRLTTLTLPTAAVGPVNPLPPLFGGADLHQVEDTSQADEEMRHNIGYGRVPSVMPYLMQDGYTRERAPAEHPVAVLENATLRATFLLGAGGRLWSLIHKPTGRELLFRNPVFQPANLALRGAWLAGGVEWNIATIGHTPTTCEPLHTARLTRPDGTPVLRMWEYERIRGVVYQIDAHLPDDSQVLLVHIRITNPRDTTVPMYWWSNIAVPEAPDVRVLAPADAAWQFSYDRRIHHIDLPAPHGTDLTRTTRSRDAADYFFDIPDHRRHWITALDASGRGLVQTSTRRLRGRKLFLWGQGEGGRHWQEWLSEPGHAYLEIQAGLARTQLEHLPMPAGAQWSWTEAYGLLEADPDAVHSTDWTTAREAAQHSLDQLLPQSALDAELQAATHWIDQQPDEILHTGSGWGALEHHRRTKTGEAPLSTPGAPFPDTTLGPEQAPWLELLHHGRITADPGRAPASHQSDPAWGDLLRAADGWLAQLHLGTLHAHTGDHQAARKAWQHSLELHPTPWAWRNLATLAAHTGDPDEAAHAYRQALQLAPTLLPLVLESAGLLLRAGHPHEVLEHLETLDTTQRATGRVRWTEARAALDTGDTDRCGRLLHEGIEVADIREGENSLHELWFAHQRATSDITPGLPLPRAYDFRMLTADATS